MNDFHILGLPVGASSADIKKAYKSLVRKYHPDINKAPDAHEKFIQIQQAYERLTEGKKSGFRFYNRTSSQKVYQKSKEEQRNEYLDALKKKVQEYRLGLITEDLKLESHLKNHPRKMYFKVLFFIPVFLILSLYFTVMGMILMYFGNDISEASTTMIFFTLLFLLPFYLLYEMKKNFNFLFE
jgi:hypothetical protein